MKKNEMIEKDINYIHASEFIDFNKFINKTIIITGATGLIGFTLTKALLKYSKEIKIIAPVRNIEKAKKMYDGLAGDNLVFIISDITQKIVTDENIDYIVHGASQTSSKAFVNEPVETIATAINGTFNMLELAK